MASPSFLDRVPQPGAPQANPTHELKNLLAVIMGVCESLADESGASGELARVGLLAAEKAGAVVSCMQNEARTPALAASAPPVDGAGRTVLVIEDDADLLKMITCAFARVGFRAYSARNGRLGVALARALKPDLIVTDIVMPEKEGIATIIEARAASAHTAVIAISGGGAYGKSGAFLQWAEELGADRVMAKPFPMSQLLSAACAVLERRRHGVRAATG
jgi:CheY-like chemotaxis protein